MPGGLYIIWFSDTHYYGGQTKDFKIRWAAHIYALKRRSHKNPYVQAVYNKYSQFRADILVECNDMAERLSIEQDWLDQHFGLPGCLNICSESVAAPMTGRKHSAETRAKISAKARGRTFSEETRSKLRDAGRRRVWTEAIRKKISQSLTGQKRPYVGDRNIACAGWKHSDEAKSKISDAGKRPCSPDTRRKISEAHKKAGSKTPGFGGKTHTVESRAKISEARKKPRLMSEEERCKRSESAKKFWTNRKLRVAK